MTFAALLELVVRDLRLRRDNGEFTERELARLAGLSQPHVHNVLAGERTLTPIVADQLLAALGLGLAVAGEAGNRAGDLFLVDRVADFRLVNLGRNGGDTLQAMTRRANRSDFVRGAGPT